ncbi:GH32 C-terminal domain-containing protein [Micromonospora sp. NPDC005113]
MKRRDLLKTGAVTTGSAVLLGVPQQAASAAATAAGAASTSMPDIVIGDFETVDWGDWVTEGDAFGAGPVRGANILAQQDVSGFRGDGVASSERAGDSPRGTLTSPAFKIERSYISFTIGGGDYEYVTCLNLIVGGKIVRTATGRNSDALMPESWDVSELLGRSAQVQIVDQASGNWGHVIVDHIVQTDSPERLPVVTQALYKETHRPQFHFTARQWAMDRLNPGQRQEGWLNDLNGLVYYDGEYHLFAQRWNKCWIHAVSRDVVHWTELEPAFWEEDLDRGVQSGTCVIDYANTSGLSKDSTKPPMVAFWSRNDNRSQCLSYSLDHGRTWTHYNNNPVLVAPERDPKVFWYAPGRHWVMLLYGQGQYHIFTSPNLLDWTDAQHPIADSFECPDFFQLPLDGDPKQMKWVLIRGSGKYSVGSFNGSEFTEETPQFDSDAGPNFYATQTWGNTDTGDGRRIQAAWMRGGAYPYMPFNQQVTFPRELTLRSTNNGPRLFREPIREIATLHNGKGGTWANRALKPGEAWNLKESGDLFHIKMQVSIPEGATLTLDIRGVPLVLTHQALACGTDPQVVSSELETVEILIDRTSIEAFANHGEVSISRCFLPAGDDLSFKAAGGLVTIRSLAVDQLNSAVRRVS